MTDACDTMVSDQPRLDADGGLWLHAAEGLAITFQMADPSTGVALDISGLDLSFVVGSLAPVTPEAGGTDQQRAIALSNADLAALTVDEPVPFYLAIAQDGGDPIVPWSGMLTRYSAARIGRPLNGDLVIQGYRSRPTVIVSQTGSADGQAILDALRDGITSSRDTLAKLNTAVEADIASLAASSASQGYVNSQITALVDGAPSGRQTLKTLGQTLDLEIAGAVAGVKGSAPSGRQDLGGLNANLENDIAAASAAILGGVDASRDTLYKLDAAQTAALAAEATALIGGAPTGRQTLGGLNTAVEADLASAVIALKGGIDSSRATLKGVDDYQTTQRAADVTALIGGAPTGRQTLGGLNTGLVADISTAIAGIVDGASSDSNTLNKLKTYVVNLITALSNSKIPCLYDYTGTTYQGDPTGSHSSDAALRQLAADCSTLGGGLRAVLIANGVDPDDLQGVPGVIGVASPGKWAIDGLSYDFFNGAGLMQAQPVYHGNKPGLFGCTFIRGSGAHNMEVLFPVHGGNRFAFAVHYPDRLAEAAGIDALGNGTLVQYAPTFATDHCLDYTGATSTTAAPENHFGDVWITGANTGAFLGEATLSEEPWAVSPSGRHFSNQNGRPSGFYRWRVNGMCMDRAVVRNSIDQTCHFETSSYGPQTWQDAAQTNLQAYLQKHCVVETLGHGATGFTSDIRARRCRSVYRFRGGVAPIGWTAGGGVDNGRYASGHCRARTEKVPNLYTFEIDAFPTSVSFDYDGVAKDQYDSSNTIPLMQYLTDKDVAGDLHPANDDNPTGVWRPCTNFGVFAPHLCLSRNSAGPVLVIGADCPNGVISFLPGSRFSSWNVNNASASDQSAYGFQHLAAANNMVLWMRGCQFNNHFGSDYIFWGTEDTSGTALTNPFYGQIAGLDMDASSSFFGYILDSGDAHYNWPHACNIQPFMPGGRIWPVGFPDGDDGDDDNNN